MPERSPRTEERPSPEVSHIARQAVDTLEIREFINKWAEPIEKKLLDCERQASDAPINNDMLFVAAALPIINGVIQIASDRTTMRKSIDWLQKQPWIKDKADADFDPVSVLSALTLIEVVNEAWRQTRAGKRNAANAAEWNSIIRRMRKLSKEMDEEEAGEETQPGV